MRLELLCPGCGLRTFDYEDYESMVMLAPDKALMQFGCPTCGLHLSIATPIPFELQEKVRAQLAEGPEGPDAGFPPLADEPRPSIVCYSSCLFDEEDVGPAQAIHPLVTSTQARARLEYFKRQLEMVDSVDAALDEIDAGYRHQRDS
jgi:hypothetical protein